MRGKNQYLIYELLLGYNDTNADDTLNKIRSILNDTEQTDTDLICDFQIVEADSLNIALNKSKFLNRTNPVYLYIKYNDMDTLWTNAYSYHHLNTF